MQTTAQQQPPAGRGGAAQAETPTVPPEFQSDKIMAMDEAGLIKLLGPGSTVFQKAKACQRLAVIGTKAAVPALAALLSDPQVAHYARTGLVPIPDASVDDALRAAASKLQGMLLVGVINSIGNRKDAKAVDMLAKLVSSGDAEVAQAAAAALGSISGPAASKALLDSLGKTKGAVQVAVAEAGLVCAEGLLDQGDRKGALALYDALTRPGVPRNPRLAALHSMLATETSLSRPR